MCDKMLNWLLEFLLEGLPELLGVVLPPLGRVLCCVLFGAGAAWVIMVGLEMDDADLKNGRALPVSGCASEAGEALWRGHWEKSGEAERTTER